MNFYEIIYCLSYGWLSAQYTQLHGTIKGNELGNIKNWITFKRKQLCMHEIKKLNI